MFAARLGVARGDAGTPGKRERRFSPRCRRPGVPSNSILLLGWRPLAERTREAAWEKMFLLMRSALIHAGFRQRGSGFIHPFTRGFPNCGHPGLFPSMPRKPRHSHLPTPRDSRLSPLHRELVRSRKEGRAPIRQIQFQRKISPIAEGRLTVF